MLASPVMAADLMMDAPVVANETSSFDWEGAYVGVFGGGIDLGNGGPYIVGGELGYNFLPSESFLLGIEVSGLVTEYGDSEVHLLGKAGVVMDRVAIYGLGGVGHWSGGDALWSVGAGVEFAATDNLSLDLQVMGRNVLGSTPNVPVVQGGLRFHF